MADKTIKIIYNNTTRRLTIPTHSNWTAFEEKLHNLFSIPTSQPLHVFYRDEDGDVITISTDIELAELLTSHNSSHGPLKILISTNPEAGGLDTAAWVFEGSISANSERTIQSEPDVLSVHSVSSIDRPTTSYTILREPQDISKDVIEKESTSSNSHDMEDVVPSKEKGKAKESWSPFEPLPETGAQSTQSAQSTQTPQPTQPTPREETQQPWAGLLNDFENLIDQFRDVLDNNPQLIASVSAIVDQIKHQIPISLEAFRQWLQSFRFEIHNPSQERSSSDEKSSNRFSFSSTPSFYMRTPGFTMSAGNPPPPPAYSPNDASSDRNETTTASASDPTSASKSVPGAYPEPQQQPRAVYSNNGPAGFFNFPVPPMAPVPPMPPRPPMSSAPFSFDPRNGFQGFGGFFGGRGGRGGGGRGNGRGGFHMWHTGGPGHHGHHGHHGFGGPGNHGFGNPQNWSELRERQQNIIAQQQTLAQQIADQVASQNVTDLRNMREQIRQTSSEAHRLAREAHRFSSSFHGEGKKEARHIEKELRKNLKQANKQLKKQVREARKHAKGKMAWSSDSSSSESDSDGESHLPEMREKQNDLTSSSSTTTTESQQPYFPTPVAFTGPSSFAPFPPFTSNNNHEAEALNILRNMGITCSDEQLKKMLERHNGDVQAVVNELFEA